MFWQRFWQNDSDLRRLSVNFHWGGDLGRVWLLRIRELWSVSHSACSISSIFDWGPIKESNAKIYSMHVLFLFMSGDSKVWPGYKSWSSFMYLYDSLILCLMLNCRSVSERGVLEWSRSILKSLPIITSGFSVDPPGGSTLGEAVFVLRSFVRLH